MEHICTKDGSAKALLGEKMRSESISEAQHEATWLQLVSDHDKGKSHLPARLPWSSQCFFQSKAVRSQESCAPSDVACETKRM
jgi:hypothetical protein